MTETKSLFYVLVLSAVLASGCGPESSATTSGKAAAPDAAKKDARKVSTVPVGEQPVDELVVVNGTLAAEQEIVLGMKTAGRLADVTVDLGSSVRKDSPVAKLDPTDFELRVRQAEAALQQARARLGLPVDSEIQRVDIAATALVKQAKAQMDEAAARRERALKLSEKGLIPQSDLDIAITSYQIAEARYEDAQDEARNRQAVLAQRTSELQIALQQRADSVVYAPLDGMVRERHANVGQYVAAGAPIITLVQINPLRLRTAVPERQARSLRIGLPVRVTVEGVAGVHQGRISRISPSIDEANRTLMIEAAVSNPSGALRPGGFARSEIVLSSGKRATTVPVASLLTFAGIDRVFAVKDGKAMEKRVKTGRRLDDQIEILEGVSVGDVVVLNPGDLNDGQVVSTTP
jgi:RND family efflux transporter MFP subunit